MVSRWHPRIDARVGFAAFLAICVMAFFVVSSLAAMTVLFVYVSVLSAAAGVRSPGRHLARLAPIIVSIVILNGLFLPGEPLVAIGGKTILSSAGTTSGVFFSLRLLVLYFTMAAFLAATPPVEFATALHSMFGPISKGLADKVAFYGFLVLSFVPLFTDEFERIRLAQSFRGADFSGGIVHRARTVPTLVVPLILSAIHRSGQLATVIELRGLRERVGVSVPATPPGVADAVFAMATAAVLIGIVVVFGSGGV